MKVRLPQLVQDRSVSERQKIDPVQNVDIENEDLFLDGPVSRRVAVLDFDHETGRLRPGASFRPAAAGRKLAGYAVRDPDDVDSPDFNQVSVFATVLKTMQMIEEPDTLGRPLVWAFGAPQLLVVPRAGLLANAFYERESHSLQFFSFDSARARRMVHTSLSQDIVAHECAHAILDGIAPDLYDAIAPQSLALHEAVADLASVVMAFRTHRLAEAVLADTRGDIDTANAFSWIAEDFGRSGDPLGRAKALRTLDNRKTFDPGGGPDFVARDEPHELSELLSGALYAVMRRSYASIRASLERRPRGGPVGGGERRPGGGGPRVWNVALYKAAQRFKRMMFRALDYLPPGEVSFADYARAILAVDQAAHPDSGRERAWLVEELVSRKVVDSPDDLKVQTDYPHPALVGVDLQALVDSDWAAYQFANENLDLLRIPRGVPFRVRPRLDVVKTFHHQEGPARMRECLFKVSWDHLEPNEGVQAVPARRRVTAGTTLAIDWYSRRVMAVLTSDCGERQRHDRDLRLRRLVEAGTLRLGRHAFGPGGRPLRSAIGGEVRHDTLRVRAAARTLHIARER